MRKLFMMFAAVAVSGQLVAKPIDINTAKHVGFNFLEGRISAEALQSADNLSLVYTAAANGVNFYYVFNAGNAGFVMISADDQVIPVIGYSNEAGFAADNIPSNAVDFFQDYADQIKYVIDNNIPATDEIRIQWNMLSGSKKTANKTTATAISPLVSTKWDQSPVYNSLCPVNGSGQAVAGCVATAMAQIMKYWNYPQKGTGDYGYYDSDFSSLISADFGNTTYDWASMPNAVTSFTNAAAKAAVATITYHAGVSVRMDYGVSSSGSYVTNSRSPYTECAEEALRTHFNYDQSLHGIERNSMSTAQWIQTLKTELDNSRPVLYAGHGNAGGHAWVADGYDNSNNQNLFHINWGWGGSSNGYFEVGGMTPSVLGTGGGSGGFNGSQHAIIGIMPPGGMTPDKYEPNNTTGNFYDFSNTSPSGPTINISADASIHIGNDIDHYSIQLPKTGAKYKVSARLHDAAKSTNGKTYTVDAKFAHSTNQTYWASYIDEEMTQPLTLSGGSDVYFRVTANNMGDQGTYLFEITVTDIATGVETVIDATDISVYPNPAASDVTVQLGGTKATAVYITDIQGRILQSVDVAGKPAVTLPVSELVNGVYFVRIQAEGNIITKKFAVSR